jgi:ketosteroid isomerase-like protein
MSRENVEIVRQAYQRVSTRLEPPRELFEPGYECDVTEVAPDIGVVRGFDGVLDALRPYWETFDGFHVEIEELIHADERRVLAAVRDGGRMRGSDAEVSNRFFHVWTFGGDKVIRLSIHTDRNRALKAAGLRE